MAIPAAPASDRVALVIGNSTYRAAPLVNPQNDANAMAELLTRAEFQVDKQLDLDLAGLQAAVERFGKHIQNPAVKLGLFYYAGHGLQQDWRNYIVPVSADIRSAADVPRQTVEMSDLLRHMEHAKDRTFLIILDACRDDPFEGAFRPSAKGLSQFDAPSGSLLAYATAPGTVAQDGTGANGLYTRHLLLELAVPGARLEDAFKRVRLGVRLASRGAQVPWESTSLEEDVYIMRHAKRRLSDAELDQLLEREMTSWRKVKTSTDPEVLAGFIREFPSGSASELAQSRLNRLLAAAVAEEAQRKQQLAAAEARKAAEALAAREADARRRAEQAEQQRVAAQRTEEERVQQARRDAEVQEARRQKAAAQAEALGQASRRAQEQAQAAVQEAAGRAAAEAQAAQIATAQEAARRAAAEQEAARVASAKAEAAQAELQRIQALQAHADAAERARTEKAEAERLALQRQAEEHQREQARLAEQQKLLLAAAPPLSPISTVLPSTPFYKGFNEHQREYTVGDETNIAVIDAFTKVSKPLVMKVTGVDVGGERVFYNGGEFESDLMGNTTSNRVGTLSTPRQFYPAELFAGKKWQTRFKQTRPNGIVYTYQYNLKVVGKERVTVPAGTFDTYKIEARGFNLELGARIERDIWVSPGVNADIVQEIKVRLRDGRWEQNDRQELMSFTQAKRPMPVTTLR